MSAILPCPEVTDIIREAGSGTFAVCMQCGTCTSVCPWNLVASYSPRTLIRLVSLGLEGFEGDSLWNCVTCHTCVERCPRGVEIADVVRATRSVVISMGSEPVEFRGPLGSLRADGNPWSGERSDRTKWREDLGVPAFGAETEWFLFTCCTQAYDARGARVGKALIGLLRRAGLSFGCLGREESCCGEMARKAGAEEVFAGLRASNTALFSEQAVRKVIVSSPHCLDAFTRDYPDLDGSLEVVHHTALLARLLEEGKLVPKREVPRRVTYHDPCYLGRHHGVYDEPRAVLSAIPGLTLVEMERSREKSLCCGGGGGGLWREIPAEQRFAVLRAREARETGADTIAVACPYCMSMLEDAIKVLDLENEIRVRDVAELLAESVGEDE